MTGKDFDESLEYMDDRRNFCEFLPRMPKSFLMAGKRKGEMMRSGMEHDSRDEDSTSDEEFISKRPRHQSENSGDEVRTPRFMSSGIFRPSAESAFSKIDRVEADESKRNSPTDMLSPPISSPFSGLYPSFYPPVLTYPFLQPNSIDAGSGNAGAFMGSYLYNSLHAAGSNNKSATSPVTPPQMDKNMFYYVDPRIPFTNYFLNLTKLLKNSSPPKEASATTPLGKMAGEEKRTGDTDHSLTPESQKSSPEKVLSPNTSYSPVSTSSCSELGEISKRRELKIDIQPERIPLPNFLDTHLPNPMATGSLFPHPHHPQAMVPLSGGGIFHPALMSLPGNAGFRRYSPEKPPPVKKYKCDVCGKAFSRSNTLVTHKRIHTGDKPFKCEICARAFRQPGNLTRHRLTHTTVKPYVCPTCNKAFNRASNLHTHMRTHTSFKSYICPYCGKGFHQKIDMKIHCYTHTAHTSRLEAQ